MSITASPLNGLLIIQPRVFSDDRGYFYESFQEQRYQELGIPRLVQDNISHSTKNVIRGLHYQKPHAQGKLAYVSRGSVWDVAVDLRRSSPTFKQWFGIQLDDRNHTQLYIPPGFAHGFCVLSDDAIFHYKCSDYYTPDAEHGIAWNDQTINISWPISNPILSPKDKQYAGLNDTSPEALFD
jgi:dTDP-4-dehydrorhamnose 3,5-epimerase